MVVSSLLSGVLLFAIIPGETASKIIVGVVGLILGALIYPIVNESTVKRRLRKLSQENAGPDKVFSCEVELSKDENQKQTLNAVLYRAAETLRWLCVLLFPVMPSATTEIWSQLGLGSSAAATPAGSDPAKLKWGELSEGTAISEVKPLFPRIDKAKTMKEINEQGRGQEAHAGGTTETGQDPTAKVQTPADTESPGAPPAMTDPSASTSSGQHATEADAGAVGVTSFIDITDFTKVDLRVGEVLTAERIPKADKLLLLTVNIGEEKPRQILAGIAQFYSPEQLLGRKIAVVANLKPRKLRGYESQGMLLAASVGEEGKPVIATFTEDVPNGARLK